MKYCERARASYAQEEARGVRVIPGGYIVAPGSSFGVGAVAPSRALFLSSINALRSARDDATTRREYAHNLLTVGAFHARNRCPERAGPYTSSLYQGERNAMKPGDYFHAIARSRCVLNLCGPENTIDRKVVEFCGVGAAIISNRGLSDLVLPRGYRFTHGHNIIYADGAPCISRWADDIPRELELSLVANTRDLFDNVFLPAALCGWYLQSVRRHMRGASE
jgi:hypothetical protein